MSFRAAGPGRASFRAVTCVVVACACCGSETAAGDGAAVEHYRNLRDAIEDLSERYGWRYVSRAGEDLFACPDCAAREECAQSGHVTVSNPPVQLEDGRLLDEMSFCDRCGIALTPGTYVSRPGYPAAAPARGDIFWDAAAFRRGGILAAAMARLMTRLDDLALAGAWNAWAGDQTYRPAPRITADPDADTAAAREVINAAQALLAWHHGSSILPAPALHPAATWRDRAPRSIVDPFGPQDEFVASYTDRRWLCHLHNMLTIAGASDVLRQIGADLGQYLTETCQHHWLSYLGEDGSLSFRRCLRCPKIEQPPGPADA
jgi:hypothetical protein